VSGRRQIILYETRIKLLSRRIIARSRRSFDHMASETKFTTCNACNAPSTMRNTLPPRCNDDGIGCILFNESAINCVSRKRPAVVASRWRRVTLIVHTTAPGNLPERSAYRASIIFMRACGEVTDTSRRERCSTGKRKTKKHSGKINHQVLL